MNQDSLERAKILLDEGRLEEALAIITPLAVQREASHRALALQSTALKGLGRRDEIGRASCRERVLFAV